MKEEDELKSLVRKIIAEHFNSDLLESYEFESSELINKLYRSQDIIKDDKSKLKTHEFGIGDAKTVVEFISLLVGTFKTIKELHKLFKNDKKSKDTVVVIWTQQLVESGIPQDKAAAIASQFHEEVRAIATEVDK